MICQYLYSADRGNGLAQGGTEELSDTYRAPTPCSAT